MVISFEAGKWIYSQWHLQKCYVGAAEKLIKNHTDQLKTVAKSQRDALASYFLFKGGCAPTKTGGVWVGWLVSAVGPSYIAVMTAEA